MSICKDCFHSYVCEQFNEHREWDNKKCHFANDHFVPNADLVKVVRCKDCKYYKQNPYNPNGDMMCMCWCDWLPTDPDDFCSYGELKECEGK